MQGVVPHPEIAPLLQEHFVALAADADDTEDEIMQLAQKLHGATMLPFVLFTDADGRFLAGSAGAQNPLTFRDKLKELIA